MEIVIGIMEMNLIYKDTVYVINQLTIWQGKERFSPAVLI